MVLMQLCCVRHIRCSERWETPILFNKASKGHVYTFLARCHYIRFCGIIHSAFFISYRSHTNFACSYHSVLFWLASILLNIVVTLRSNILSVIIDINKHFTNLFSISLHYTRFSQLFLAVFPLGLISMVSFL